MNKSIKTLLLGVFLISPIVLLVLYTANTARKEAPVTNVNLSKLKLVTPVAIIDEITKKIEEEDLDDAIIKINSDLPDPNIPSSKGTPLLVLAAEKDYTDIVAALIQKGANPNKADLNTSETALIKAVRNQNFDTISVLLNAGANPNLGTNQGVTPLGLAIDLKNESLAAHLLSSGATNGISKENLLLYAFKKNDIGVALMLSGGVNPNVTDQDNNTPLIISAANGDLNSAKQLISYRANTNAKNKYGMTPLLYAVKGKHWDMAEYLINNGANINSSNIYGQNVLFWASYHGNAKLVHDLLMRGANYQKKTRRGQTALQMARAYGHKEAAKMLEDFIAYKNLPRDEKGNIILPKVKQQQTASMSVPVNSYENQNTSTADYVNNSIEAEINKAQQAEQIIVKEKQVPTVAQDSVTQTLGTTPKLGNNTQKNQLPASSQNTKQPAKTQINSLPNTSNQAEMPQMPQMPEGMDMNAIMSMMGGGQGAQSNSTGKMMKQMENLGKAGGSKTQQMQGMPAGAEMPAGMNMGDISKMIPAGALPAGMDLNNLTSMTPEQLKKMGVPDDQIANITNIKQQMGQAQNMQNANPADIMKSMQNIIPQTQGNKTQTTGK